MVKLRCGSPSWWRFWLEEWGTDTEQAPSSALSQQPVVVAIEADQAGVLTATCIIEPEHGVPDVCYSTKCD